MRSTRFLVLFASFGLPLATLGAQATQSSQSSRVSRFLDNCRNGRDNDDSERACETRDVPMQAASNISIDGRDNGSVTVHAWDKATVQVTAMIEAHADHEDDARAMLKDVQITAKDGELGADGPSHHRHEWWSVSYEIYLPKHTDLSIEARNGAISVEGVDSHMDLRTVNGGLSLTDLAGDVRGTTVNGGVTADLAGDKWNGAGLDVRTTNGGVRLYIPSSYSARLETGTTNGGMNIGFPITVQGSFGRRLSTQLGSGGATIRVVTTNGGVSIQRR